MINAQNSQVQKDLVSITKTDLPWQKLRGKTILVAGATGMLGSYFALTLCHLNQKFGLNIRILLLARNETKLQQFFVDSNDGVSFLLQDVCTQVVYQDDIHYIFHAAGSANPYHLVHDPVGVLKANSVGTLNLLETAVQNNCEAFLFASTREIYGEIKSTQSISEPDMGILDPLVARNAYPESKRFAEALLQAYSVQHNVPFNSLRIAHTYGPTMQLKNDGRVMADVINDVIHGRDISLHGAGEAQRAFCYLTDAITGIFSVLLNGERNRAYNLANEREPVSIKELAQRAITISGQSLQVKTNSQPNAVGYTTYVRRALDTSALESLGWKPIISLDEGLLRTLQGVSQSGI